MTLFPIIGHAARVGMQFFNADKGRHEVFRPGCFADAADRAVILAVNHAACRCFTGEPRIDPRLVFASTTDSTLTLTEDAYGLRFTALLPHDAAVQYGDSTPINLLEAIADGRCAGASIHGHGGARSIDAPVTTLAWARVNLIDVSLVINKPPGSPGTWVAIDTAAARTRLAERLREAEAASCQAS